MKIPFHIVGSKGTKHTSDTDDLDLKIDYTVSTNNLFVSYENETSLGNGNIVAKQRSFNKINHIIQGEIQWKNVTFSLTIGAVFEHGELFYEIISQDSNYGDFYVAQNYRLFNDNGGREIIDFDEYFTLQKLNYDQEENISLSNLADISKGDYYEIYNIELNQSLKKEQLEELEVKLNTLSRDEIASLKLHKTVNLQEFRDIDMLIIEKGL